MNDETGARCDICYHALRFEFCLNCHVKKVTCLECIVPFSSFAKFQKHLIEHPYSTDSVLECVFLLHDRRSRQFFACVICSFLFDKISNLVTHERSVHRTSKTYSCAYCEMKCSARSTIIRHLKIHEEEPLFECSSCGKKFHGRRELEQHKKFHTSDLNYKCKYCEKMFKTEFIMKRHVLQHSSQKFYSCPICGLSFMFHYSMKRHLSTHDQSSETFQCYHCSRTYKWKGDLRRHIHVNHLQINRHECRICHKSFSRKSYLLEHGTSHGQARTYLCFCGLTFRYRSNLARHKKLIHKN